MIGFIKKNLTYSQIIALGYLTMILIGSLLLSLPASSRNGEGTPFIDALFTATSATCVTGLVVVDTYTYWSGFGQLVILSLIQIGGLGFMTMISILSMFWKRQIGLHERRLLMQSTGTLKLGGVVRLVRRIILLTLCFEGIGVFLLSFRFCKEFGFADGLYQAVFHSISAFCNAGFDIMGMRSPYSSLSHYSGDALVTLTISILIVIGGLGFFVLNDLVQNGLKWKKYQLHTKMVLMISLVLTLSGTLLFYVFEGSHTLANASPAGKILTAFFHSVTPRTAGFNMVDTASLSESGSLLTMILMFIGGSPGSTAGGIKTTTFVILILGTVASSRRHSHIQLFKRRIDEMTIKQAGAIATMYLMAIVCSVMILCFIEPMTFKVLLFESVSAAGTVGLSTGITGLLGSVSKGVLMLLMYGGRVGGLTLVLLLSESKSSTLLDRPIEKVMIG